MTRDDVIVLDGEREGACGVGLGDGVDVLDSDARCRYLPGTVYRVLDVVSH